MAVIVVFSAALSVISHGNAAEFGICVAAASSFEAVRLTSATEYPFDDQSAAHECPMPGP